MSTSPIISEDQLVSELWARDVQFLTGRQLNSTPLFAPEQLIASLAESADARIRFSLIPLFLRHPEFSTKVKKADKLLSLQASKFVLWFYYTAAVFLQKKYHRRITQILGKQPQLPDLFSSRLGILPDKKPDQALIQLAKQHQTLSRQSVNWLGTYEHAADVWLRQMELQKV